MVSDRMGARAVDLLLGQISATEGPPQQVVMRTFLKVLVMVRFPSHRLLGCFVTRKTVDEPCAFRSTDARRTTRRSPPGFPSPHACLGA